MSANTEISEPGECRLLRNQEKLFIRFDFSGTAVPSKRDLTRDGKVWLEDCFQIFIAPSPEKEEYFHFAGNSAGTLYDAKCKAGKRDASWNCDWKAKMEKKADHWSAEVEIPFSALGGSPDNGKYWLFHIGRENPERMRSSRGISAATFIIPHFGDGFTSLLRNHCLMYISIL